MTNVKKAFHTPLQSTPHSPLENEEKKPRSKNPKTLEQLKNRELAEKHEAEEAALSDHRDNIVFKHGPSNRGK
jgi:hypothetical protein